MKLDKNLLTLLCLVFPLFLPAQVESIFNDVRLNQSVQVVSEKLADIAEGSNVISIDKPSFPLAMYKEAETPNIRTTADTKLIITHFFPIKGFFLISL